MLAQILLFISIFGAEPQSSTLPEGTYHSRLDSLSDSVRVAFIIDNFYEIYSKDLDEAVKFGNYAINTSKQHGWKSQEAYAHMFYAIGQYLKGDYTKALPAMLRASDMFDSLNHYKGIARVNNELSVFYRKHQDTIKMMQCLKKAEAVALQHNDKASLSTTYHHLGATLSQKGKFDEALPYFQKVLELRIDLQDSVGLGYIYLDFAEYHVNKGNLEKALKYIDKSSAIRKKMGDIQGVAINEVSIGEAYFANEDYTKAIPYFKKTIDLAIPIGFTDLVRYAYDKLQKSEMEIGDYKKAYESMVNFQIYNDSIFNVEKSRAVTEISEKYESEKKEQQIAMQQLQLAQKDAQLEIKELLIGIMAIAVISLLLIGYLWRKRLILKRERLLEQEKRKTRELELKAALASQEQERSRVARDLHDGFGQMISILNLNLKSLEIENVDRHLVFEQSASVLEDMYQELKSICFNLMPQTLIKSGIMAAIREFALRVNQTGKLTVETDFFGLGERLTEVQEISLYRITQEWINNTLKYSDADRVNVQITKDENEITLLIEDNGTGFDLGLMQSGKGNGWRNMNSRANLIKGKLEVDTTQGMRGSTLIVNAPVKSAEEVLY